MSTQHTDVVRSSGISHLVTAAQCGRELGRRANGCQCPRCLAVIGRDVVERQTDQVGLYASDRVGWGVPEHLAWFAHPRPPLCVGRWRECCVRLEEDIAVSYCSEDA